MSKRSDMSATSRKVRVWGRTPDKVKAVAKEHGCIAMDTEGAVRAPPMS
ncbi:MAG: hypothetical protein VX107_03960 [Pseudomonadota bacterium]|nr:hypothetical protein [Pseudomonadota bacterium]